MRTVFKIVNMIGIEWCLDAHRSALIFIRIIMQDKMSRKDDPNDYILHDPLLEKGKEKFNQMQAKQKRREREWAGKSLTWSHLCQVFELVNKNFLKADITNESVHEPVCFCYEVWLLKLCTDYSIMQAKVPGTQGKLRCIFQQQFVIIFLTFVWSGRIGGRASCAVKDVWRSYLVVWFYSVNLKTWLQWTDLKVIVHITKS